MSRGASCTWDRVGQVPPGGVCGTGPVRIPLKGNESSHHKPRQQTLSGPRLDPLSHPGGHERAAPGHNDCPGVITGAE